MAEAETSELEAPPVIVTELPKESLKVSGSVRRAGWIAPIIGGVIAAALGFGLAQYVPNGWPLPDNAAFQAALSAQQAETKDIKAQIAALAAKPPALDTNLQAQVADLAKRATPDLTTLQQQIADIEQRLTAMEATPISGNAPSAAALAAQKEAADAVLKQAEETAARINADAEAIAKAADVRAALGRVQAALDSGAAYGSALPSLGKVSAILTENAKTGLPTLANLQNAFPAAARLALEAALRANMGETWSDRVANFLRTQTGARSLTPREGNDPDAILSRAQAALAAGDIATTLTEISALPPEAQVALADWQALAQTRQAAVKAVADLAAAIE